MPDLTTQTGGNFLKVFVQSWNSFAEQMEQKIFDYFRQQVSLGRSTQDVIRELEESQKAGTGIFKRLMGEAELNLENGLNTVFQIESNNFQADLVEWVLDPTAEHCDSCLAQAAKGPRPMDEMPLPSTQPTIGETNCHVFCKCTLQPVGVAIAP